MVAVPDGFRPAPQAPRPDAQPVDAGALRRWAGAALAVLGRSREEIDALNVFPIADADTGTNMYLTFEAACRALDDRLAAPGPAPSVPEALHALAHGALLGARGNSGVILSQLLRGAAGARYTGSAVDGPALAIGLTEAARLAREAVARPAEGTIITVADAAAKAARDALDDLRSALASTGTATSSTATATSSPALDFNSLAVVAQAAANGARIALAYTPEQLEVLRRAGVVDAGGQGLVMILDTLAAYTGGMDPRHAFRQRRLSTTRAAPSPLPTTSRQFPAIDPAYEVIYLLDARDEAVTGPTGLRSALDAFCENGGGDSLVVVGGEGLWRVHVHVDDPGWAIEAGIQAGRPYDIKITYFLGDGSHDAAASPTTLGLAEQSRTSGQKQPSTHAPAVRPTRAVIAVAYGPGLAALFEEAGAQVLQASGDRPPSAADLERAIDETRADEVVLLANDADTSEVAAAVAERFGAEWAQGDGRARRPAGSRPVRVAAVPAKVTVQGIAALAVHEPTRRFDADVVAMTAAAGATRYGALEVAAVEAWTMAGMCRAGQILGHVENDVALIEDDQFAAASAVLGRMLSAGGEMVTLVVGRGADDGLSEAVAGWLHERHPVVDVVAYEGGQAEYPLLIGVE